MLGFLFFVGRDEEDISVMADAAVRVRLEARGFELVIDLGFSTNVDVEVPSY